MDITLLILRVVHVVAAIFWAGAALFVTHFLEPAVRDLGPDGGRVMQALQKRGFLTAMPAMGVLTLVSGFWLYWRDFGRFHPGPGAAGAEIVFAVGALASVLALGVGIVVMRPSAARLSRLAGEMGQAAPERRDAITTELARLRGRMRVGGRVVVLLLTVAMVTMAIGRYS
jgi:uncharacterized membrane protein